MSFKLTDNPNIRKLLYKLNSRFRKINIEDNIFYKFEIITDIKDDKLLNDLLNSINFKFRLYMPDNVDIMVFIYSVDPKEKMINAVNEDALKLINKFFGNSYKKTKDRLKFELTIKAYRRKEELIKN